DRRNNWRLPRFTVSALTLDLHFAMLTHRCLLITSSGCMTGSTGSPRLITIAWCGPWSGASSGRGIGHAATASLRDTYLERKLREVSCEITNGASWNRATSFIPTLRLRIFGSSVARYRSSARGKYPTRNWKPRYAAPTPSFYVSLRRFGRLIRRTIWP